MLAILNRRENPGKIVSNTLEGMRLEMNYPNEPHSTNLAFIEHLYAEYSQDPQSVSEDWQNYFSSLAEKSDHQAQPFQIGPHLKPTSIFAGGSTIANNPQQSPQTSKDNLDSDYSKITQLQDKVFHLVRAYRDRGHLIAKIDPLDIPRAPLPELFPAFYGFSDKDMELVFPAGTIHLDRSLSLREIIEHLRTTYCSSIGVQFMHIDDWVTKHWLEDRMEKTGNRVQLDRNEQLQILTKLTDAVIFEEFIQKKFRGAKSFSLEGCESLLPLLHQTIERSGKDGVEEIVLAMAHRGRLNVMANIMGKGPKHIFQEFFDKNAELLVGRGDVKYHLGYSTDWITQENKEIHISLCFNPSHLEFVNPVALGKLRAKQDRMDDTKRERALAILIHGDAAFAGEGVVQETLNLSALKPYHTGGALHIIVNNQIGFTTPPQESRSCIYATDVARMLQCPIFHVNGEDPEAVTQVVRLAMDYRQAYQQDVVIDMYGYRRHGHNEGDEPAFTQPLLYKTIREKPSVRDSYLENLLKIGDIQRQEADTISAERQQLLEEALAEAGKTKQTSPVVHCQTGIWENYRGGLDHETPLGSTKIPLKSIQNLMDCITTLPKKFTPHPKIKRLLKNRKEMGKGDRAFDWGAAEIMAFASLAAEGYPVRLSGQDCERGTFSHRHAVIHDFKTGEKHSTLSNLTKDQATVEIYNSPLSEAAVLGFEYGYSLNMPEGLILWEAQFGDFVNTAQVIIDQFISSAEDKWQQLSGLVMLLPHAMEGMGPEHSSARLERFLTMTAEDNFQITYPSTPAQFFHLLRRQVIRPYRKPLIVMTPKSLLRHPGAISSLDELSKGSFQHIISDNAALPHHEINRIILCSGKIFYELEKMRHEYNKKNIAILRLEQLYPLPDSILQKELNPYKVKTEVVWVQEEPENMGAWRYLRSTYGDNIFGKYPLRGISRPESSSPATGSKSSHQLEQSMLIRNALGIND